MLPKQLIQKVNVLVSHVQVYRYCSHIDISGLKDPRLHEQTIISALYNLGRLLDDDGRHQVPLLTYLTTHLYSFCCQRVRPTYLALSKFVHILLLLAPLILFINFRSLCLYFIEFASRQCLYHSM